MFYVGNQSLDDLFEPRQSAPTFDTSYFFNGVDITNRYEPIDSGSPITGEAGYICVEMVNDPQLGLIPVERDLSVVFAAKGSVQAWNGSVAALPGLVEGVGDAFSPDLTVGIRLYRNGTIETFGSSGTANHGSWHGSAADADNTQLRYVVTGDPSPASLQNDAPNWIDFNSALNPAVVGMSNSSTTNFGQVDVSVEIRSINDNSLISTKTVTLYIDPAP